MPNHFFGTIQDFDQLLRKSGVSGVWHTQPKGPYVFQAGSGGVLKWSLITGSIWLEGGVDLLLSKFVASPEAQPFATPKPGSIFIVHGHDHSELGNLTDFLKKLGLTPIILADSDGGGMTLIEALESGEFGIGEADFGIVLLTDDDMGYAKRDGSTKIQPRARQNVIFEMGMLMVKLTRRNVAMVIKNMVERPSDTDGIIYHTYTTDLISEAGPKLIKRFERSGMRFGDQQTTDALASKK